MKWKNSGSIEKVEKGHNIWCTRRVMGMNTTNG